MNIYSCSPFLNEFHLLDLKMSEELDMIDKMFLIESNQTLHCNHKPLNLEGKTQYTEHPKVECCFIRDKFNEDNHYNNDTIQKDSILNFFEYEDDDVILCCDLDEINKKEDIPFIVDQAKKHGFIKLCEHLFYYRINLRRSPRKGWRSCFAITGKRLREENGEIHRLRRTKSTPVETNGKHFSYLMSPENIAYKIMNAGHPEYMKDRFTDTEKIQHRIDNQIDPFERVIQGEVMKLEKIELDETYPSTILNNLDLWKEYMS